jgi:dGTPase
MQLFPSDENDFFRNRLTHSLEVAQIASGLALDFNSKDAFFKNNNIDVDLVYFAGLAHDLGHPPFGHNGEKALDRLAVGLGGFEGNAQTLRILSRLEKKATVSYPAKIEPDPVIDDNDNRLGLNLTYRTLASILKYDCNIPRTKDERAESDRGRPVKGYYFTEHALVADIKSHVAGDFDGRFRTIECGIMDIADDIAYSTYDLEDSLKAGFISPLKMLSFKTEFKKKIIDKINSKIKEQYEEEYEREKLSTNDFDAFVAVIFQDIFGVSGQLKSRLLAEPKISEDLIADIALIGAGQASAASESLCENGYLRGEFTSKLVTDFMRAVRIKIDQRNPKLSKVYLDVHTFKVVEFLKTISYMSIIESPRLKMAESRGAAIIKRIFRALKDESSGERLLPEDWREIYFGFKTEQKRKRTICDFIASMTDRYCVEFYSRIVGLNPPSIYKPY